MGLYVRLFIMHGYLVQKSTVEQINRKKIDKGDFF